MARVETYNYDALDQLEKETGLVNHTYLHDSRHRRLAKDDTRTLVDSLDQIESMSDDTSQFVYDLDGRLLSYLRDGEVCLMSYDAWSRLTTFKRGDLEVHYVYDAYDRCMTRLTKQGETEQLQQYGYIDRKLVSIESDGNFQHRVFVRGDSTEQGDTLAWEVEGQVRLPILDLGGSTIGWMDRSGSILARWSFDSFGMPLQQMLGPWGYCSKLHETATDLVYFSKRYYIPSWGRWLTRDPKGEIDGSNLYAYVGNNPLTRVDSWGLMTDFDRGSYNDKSFNLYETGDNGSGWQFDYASFLLSEARQTLFDREPTYNKTANVYIVQTPFTKQNAENEKTALVTGAGNTLNHALRSAHILACLLATDVILGYIPTAGTMSDLINGLLERNGVKDIPPEHAKIVFDVIEAGTADGATLNLFAHSRGNHAVREVDLAYGKSNYDTFQRVYVYGVAGSGDLFFESNFAGVLNAVCTRDFVIRLFDNGAIERQRESGILIEIKPYNGNDRGPLTFSEHTFDCPSSQTAIERHGKHIKGRPR